MEVVGLRLLWWRVQWVAHGERPYPPGRRATSLGQPVEACRVLAARSSSCSLDGRSQPAGPSWEPIADVRSRPLVRVRRDWR